MFVSNDQYVDGVYRDLEVRGLKNVLCAAIVGKRQATPTHFEQFMELLDWYALRIFPQNVYGMAVDLKTAEFTPWTALIDQFVFNKDEPYFNIMVPTADTTR